MSNRLTFSQALEAIQAGHFLARKGWNGKDMFVYMVQQSDVWLNELRGSAAEAINQADNGDQFRTIKIHPHIDMKTADGSISVGWRPTNPDMFAADWYIVKKK